MSARRGSWRAIGESVIGVTHSREGRSCQDAFRISVAASEFAVAAVADGHGQAKSFRSGEGAGLAVDVAVDVFADYARSAPRGEGNAYHAMKDLAGHLPRVVAQTWRERVWEHVQGHPLSIDEHAACGGRFPIVLDQPMTADAYRSLWRMYGTTLIAVLVTESYAVALQIGDGLLMATGASGEAFEVLDPDALNFGTSTTSLSDEDAELRVRWRLIPHEGDFPVLYWLCTDGYEKAFRTEDHGAVCLEYRDAFRGPDGWRIIKENLNEGLHQASATGTGDDATSAFLYFDEGDSAGVTFVDCEPVAADPNQDDAIDPSASQRGGTDGLEGGEPFVSEPAADAPAPGTGDSSLPRGRDEQPATDLVGRDRPLSPIDKPVITPDGEATDQC